MLKKKKRLDRFFDLTWNDIEGWAGGKIVSRGKSYQRQGRVSDLAVTDAGSLIAWVDGTERYATRVVMEEDGLPDSMCTCPYGLDCKHGVAVVIEYLERLEKNRRIPKAKRDDDRLELLAYEGSDDEASYDENTVFEDAGKEINAFLKRKTKAQLIELINEIARQHPEIALDLVDRRQLISGHVKPLVTRLRSEIQDIGDEPGWQNYWQGDGDTPDYSGIRRRLKTLLDAGHADEVLTLGRDLVTTGIRQVEESNDEGETEMEIAACMPVIVEALERSSLDGVDSLTWALDVVLDDQFEICEAFAEFLYRRHPKTAWHALADLLLARLNGLKGARGADDFSSTYKRDRLSDWAIHALERAGRKKEIIPLCEDEALKTGSYLRLVDRLIALKRHEDAERWIKQGIRDIGKKWPSIASGLRDKLRELRKIEKNRPAVAAMLVEEFVHYPSIKAFDDCKKACAGIKAWPRVRESLLDYLEKGALPWNRKGWPLPETGLDAPVTGRKDQFPIIQDLISIAILEKEPAQVLHWYDKLSRKGFGWRGGYDDEVAAAVQTYAPDRAVVIWKKMAEGLIAQVKPSAYQEAAKYLGKAAKVMKRLKRQKDWEKYLKGLREAHVRKRRLMEILNGLEEKPIVKRKR